MIDVNAFVLVVFLEGNTLRFFWLGLLDGLLSLLQSFLDIFLLVLLVMEIANIASSSTFLSGLVAE